MSLMDKYADLFALANTIGLKNPEVTEEGGKLKISGQTEYQLDANRLWDNIKTHSGWENEVVAKITALHTDVHGMHTVAPARRCPSSPRNSSATPAATWRSSTPTRTR